MSAEPTASKDGSTTKASKSRTQFGLFLPWALLAVVVLAIFLGVLSLVRIPSPRPTPSISSKTETKIGVDLTQGLLMEADLLDPTPLFLPTRINAGFSIKPKNLQFASQGSFRTFPPFLVNKVDNVELSFPPIAIVPSSPAGALRVGDQPNPYRTIGQADMKLEKLTGRLGYLEVLPTKGGGAVIYGPLPEIEDAPVGDWQSIEWMAAVDRKGIVGNMALVVSSGAEECDTFFRKYLLRQFRLGERLRPGYYRVRVGP